MTPNTIKKDGVTIKKDGVTIKKDGVKGPHGFVRDGQSPSLYIGATKAQVVRGIRLMRLQNSGDQTPFRVSSP